MRMRKNSKSALVDSAAIAEGLAVERLSALRPVRAGNHITASIPWSPGSFSKNGKFRPGRDTLRGPLVRGHSSRTPKLAASYVRIFDTE